MSFKSSSGSSTAWTGAGAFFFFGFGTAMMVSQLSIEPVTLPVVKFFFGSTRAKKTKPMRSSSSKGVSVSKNPYAGADIDDVTEEQAQRWIDRFDSYTERSPSANGFHIICKAEVPKGTNRDEGELYSSGRFFTMTGDVVRDAPIREAQDAANEFYRYLRRGDNAPTERAPTTPALTDAEVVRLAENARNGAEFSVVYRGGGQFKSASERDLSLASRLAFWTQDEAQIERIMRGSGCVREKWDKHRTYLRDTIGKALSGLTEAYHPSTNGTNNANSPSEARPQPITAAELMEM